MHANEEKQQYFSTALRHATLWQRAEAKSNSLLILVPGLHTNMTGYEDELWNLLNNSSSPVKDADFIAFKYNRGWTSRKSPLEIGKCLNKFVETKGKDYDVIHIFAHSAGGLIVRAAIVVAQEDSQKSKKVPWFRSKLHKCVFAASTHRGFVIQPNAPLARIVMTAIIVFADMTNLWRVIESTGFFRLSMSVWREGAWVSNLRLRWHWAFDAANVQSPHTTHIRGGDDELIGWDDDAVPFCFPNTKKMVLNSSKGHKDWSRPKSGGATQSHLLDAFRGSISTAATHPSVASDCSGVITVQKSVSITATRSFEGENQTREVIVEQSTNLVQINANRDRGRGNQCQQQDQVQLVFIVHGIRDYGEWQKEIQSQLEASIRNVRVVKVRYGYFSAVQFAIPDLRQQSIRSFRLQYLEEVLSRPELDARNISAMGHSNGTFAIGEFLRRYPQARIGRLLLAAPVLPRDFPWEEVSKSSGVSRVHTECAVGDVPVGVLCKAISWFFGPWKTVGNAGYRGFSTCASFVTNHIRVGGHGQIFRQENYAKRIANFLEGHEWDAVDQNFDAKPGWTMAILSIVATATIPLVCIGLGSAIYFFPIGYTAAVCLALLVGLLAIKI